MNHTRNTEILIANVCVILQTEGRNPEESHAAQQDTTAPFDQYGKITRMPEKRLDR